MEYVKMKSNYKNISFFFENPKLIITIPIKHPDAEHATLSKNNLNLTEKDITTLINVGLGKEQLQ